MQDQDFTCTEQAIEVASNVLRGALERPNHTNVGEVDSLLQRAKLNYTKRISKIPRDKRDYEMTFEAIDLDLDLGRCLRLDCWKLLEGSVHIRIIERFFRYQNRYLNAARHGLNPRDFIPTRFVFKGPSGVWHITPTRRHIDINVYLNRHRENHNSAKDG